MRTPAVVFFSALASAAIAAPTAVVAHEYLGRVISENPGTQASPGQTQPGENPSSGGGDGGTAASSEGGTTTQATSEQSRGVVMIDTAMGAGEGAGTGMVLTPDGTVLTNYHVVNGSTHIRVALPNGQAYTADVVGHDQSHDVAVLKLRGARGLATVSLDTSPVGISDPVLAVGQGNGEGVLFAAKGKVVGTNKRITAMDDSSLASSETLTGLLEIDAPIVPGYSGGPLFDRSGKVIGIDTAASATNSLTAYDANKQRSRNDGYAIPIATAKAIADDIKAGRKTSSTHIGPRAALGIGVYPSKRGQSPDGVVVQNVTSDEGVAAAGVKSGDTITNIGGRRITNTTDLSHVMDDQYPGSKVKVTWRDGTGASHSATVTLGKSPAN